MRVLFLTRLFYPHIGGVERHVMELSKRLVERGDEASVITEADSHNFQFSIFNFQSNSNVKILNKKTPGKIEIYRIPVGKDSWFKKFRIWQWMWKHRELISSADVVHCHDVFFWYLPFRFLFPQKKVFTTFHGYESYPISKKAIIVRKISELLSFGNICIGDFIKKWYKTKATFVSYGGVNAKNQKSKIKNQRLEKAREKYSAVFIGRLDEQTGILTYLKAVELIKKKIPGFKFTVIGEGRFKNKIPKDIEVLGFQERVEEYFPEFNFAFVSRYLSILEAIAAKRLVFALYDNPVKRDYLKMAPFAKFVIISNSEKELAEKVLFFLKNPDKEKELVDDAFNWVKNQTWEKVLQTYLNLWKK
ncbi:MAG: glycosyltransferase family 4 protein [Candidatus Levyibacteriota bacterium]